MSTHPSFSSTRRPVFCETEKSSRIQRASAAHHHPLGFPILLCSTADQVLLRRKARRAKHQQLHKMPTAKQVHITGHFALDTKPPNNAPITPSAPGGILPLRRTKKRFFRKIRIAAAIFSRRQRPYRWPQCGCSSPVPSSLALHEADYS